MTPVLFLVLTLLSNIILTGQSYDYLYISPVPGSENINPEQVICLKTGHAFDASTILEEDVQLEGSRSGVMDVKIKLSDDQMVLFIEPEQHYHYNEKITISLPGCFYTDIGLNIKHKTFSFYTAVNDNRYLSKDFFEGEYSDFEQNQNESVIPLTGYDFNKGNNLPPDYPSPTVSLFEDPDDDYIFFTVMSKNGTVYSPYITIWDNYGVPVYYQKMDGQTMNFYVTENEKLIFGTTTGMSNASKRFYVMNTAFQVLDTAEMGNGYDVDLHDFLILNNNHYLMQSYDTRIINMSEIIEGGHPAAQVTGLVIQEVDQQQNVYFQWRSWDHFEITDATPDIDLTAQTIDYCHGNALTIDHDGHLLISCRNMDEITKINFQTGDIIWRWGKWAKNNQFTLINDPTGFSHQHDIRILPGGHYTVYDNGNNHFPQVSQAMEYNIDEENMTAERVWYYRHEPEIFAFATGSHQRTSTNKSLIGWGWYSPLAITEVRLDGTTTLEIFLPNDVMGYRSLKYPWETSLFETQDVLDFGSYTGDNFAISKELAVTNNASYSISLTSTHNHSDDFFVDEQFPVFLPAGQIRHITVCFEPEQQGYYDDLLTLNSDNNDNTQRIARQVKLFGYWDETPPTVEITPEDGSTNINLDTIIIALFNEPVRKPGGELITSNYIQEMFYFREDDVNGNDVPFYGSIDNTQQKIKLIPQDLLLENQQYYIELRENSVEDRAGNGIPEQQISVFHTRNIVNIDNHSENIGFSISPNPAHEVLHIRLDATSTNNSKITLLNIQGKEIYSRQIPPDINSIQIPLDGFKEGIYLVQYTLLSYQEIKKFLIIK